MSQSVIRASQMATAHAVYFSALDTDAGHAGFIELRAISSASPASANCFTARDMRFETTLLRACFAFTDDSYFTARRRHRGRRCRRAPLKVLLRRKLYIARLILLPERAAMREHTHLPR